MNKRRSEPVPAKRRILRKKDTVRKKKKNSNRLQRQTMPFRVSFLNVFFFILTLMIAAGGMIYHLNVRFQGVRLGYQASQLRKEQSRLLLEQRKLRLELAALKEPGHIEDVAKEKLGMENPDFDRIVPVGKKRKSISVSGGAL